MRSVRFKFIGVIVGMVVIYFIIFYFFFESYTRLDKIIHVGLKHVVVHLDLKGSPPNLQYLVSLLPLFKRLGVNGILMEYEDSFPYQGAIANLSSMKPYDSAELKKFLTRAFKLQIEIIPLIQTFGHMEHALKLSKYQHLREVKEYPDSICPSHEDTLRLISEMLRQVIGFHESITPLKHIHIGCDEVYQLNKCNKCRSRKLTNRNLFIDHVRSIKALIYSSNPLIQVLMWDDMFRQIKPYQWDPTIMSELELVEPVYWDYTPQLKRTSHEALFRYHYSFKNIWIASAFKGADSKMGSIPNIKNRFQNHYSWLQLASNYVFAGEKRVFKFKGVILTGWSRYSHFDPLCELLPVSIRSLIMNLLLIEKFRNGVIMSDVMLKPDVFFDKHIARKLEHELRCEDNVLSYQYMDVAVDTCKFKGNHLISTLKRYKYMMADIDATFKSDIAIVQLVEYYSQIENLNEKHADTSLNWCKNILKEMIRWEKEMSYILIHYYDKFVIEEYVGYKIYSAKKKIQNTLHKLINYKKVQIWDRRKYNFTFT